MSDHASAIRGIPRWHPNPLVQDALHRIRSYGWSVTAVSELCKYCAAEGKTPEEIPDTAFAYTAGLVLHDQPELLVFGLDAITANGVLNELGDTLHRCDWRSLVAADTEIALRSLDVPVRLIEVIDKDDMTIANELFPDAPAVQVVWPDDHGSYPWDERYGLDHVHQPIKGLLPDPNIRAVGPRVISRSYGPNRQQRRRRRPTAG